ncbi:MAG: hypothetical protein CENE_02874 [Candidatus Celerinatantimonas neptuna]|nr:MAG: hypothetical protein CENE_02874 [Candidatus Celerinatantimonas neptuna]
MTTHPPLIKRPVIILTIAVIIIVIGVGGYAYYSHFRHISNPILGRWESQVPHFGKTEILEFTSQGMIKNGGVVATRYKVSSNKVVVETNSRKYIYTISNDGQRLFIYMPRVGKLTYIRVAVSSSNR